MQRIVCQAFDYLRFDTAAIDERFELLSDVQICSTDKTSDDGVTASIVPVGLRLGSWVLLQFGNVHQYIPRAEDFRTVAETVAIVPFFQLFFLVQQIPRLQQGIDLRCGKAELVCKFRIGKRVAGKVVQSGENAFLGDAQATGEYGELEGSIGFQCRSQHIADKAHHFIVIAVLLGAGEGHIVFIDEEDDWLAPMILEGAAKRQQGVFKLRNITIAALKC